MSKRGRTLVLLLSFALTSLGIEISRADSFNWTFISNANLPAATGIKSLAMSSDGSTIIVGRSGDGVYISTNSGSSFSQVSTSSIPTGTYFVAISANGMKMLAGSSSASTVYYSTDKGSTWTSRASNSSSSAVNRVCMSGDGSRWIALANAGVYTSTNDGGTWTAFASLTAAAWWSCSMSNDGTKIFALRFGAALRYSVDSGANWSTSATAYPTANIVASSSDGSVIALTDRDVKKVYISTNYGSTYTEKYLAAASIYDVAISSDGSRLAVATGLGRIITSINSGGNWVTESAVPSTTWGAVAMDASGTKIIAGAANGGTSAQIANFPLPATLSLQSISPNASPLIYNTRYTLTLLSNSAGKVTFYANGKKITKCSQVPTVSLVATCAYKPNVHGVITLSATVIPSDSAYFSATSQFLQTSAVARTTRR